MRIFPQVGPLRLVLRLVLLAVAAGVFAFYVPTPYTLNAPGHAEDLSEIVHVAGKPPSPPGHLYMTTVVHERANLLFCLYALMDPEAQLLPAEYSVPRVLPARPKGPELPGSFNPENMMAQSKYIARVQALRYMGYKLDIESHGAQVLDFL
ncbi:MAG: hypothetical protein FJX76_26595, partial [Armatimonadetes bacterium]|nr:hypothetical protein [Armatimonadota bacterium]